MFQLAPPFFRGTKGLWKALVIAFRLSLQDIRLSEIGPLRRKEGTGRKEGRLNGWSMALALPYFISHWHRCQSSDMGAVELFWPFVQNLNEVYVRRDKIWYCYVVAVWVAALLACHDPYLLPIIFARVAPVKFFVGVNLFIIVLPSKGIGTTPLPYNEI